MGKKRWGGSEGVFLSNKKTSTLFTLIAAVKISTQSKWIIKRK